MDKIETRGRKPVPKAERRSEWIGAAVTRAQKKAFAARAAALGRSESDHLRRCAGVESPEKPAD